MAIWSMEVKVFSRGKGQSAVAAAAYRSGQNLRSEKDQEVKKARSQSEVVHSDILTPDSAPDWAHDRETLWNEVEKKENRKNSQLSREVMISIPRELSDEQKKKLVESYARDQFVSRGMVADVNMHQAKASDGKDNPHAHIMLTLRSFDEDGQWAKHKNREWNDKATFEEWREGWEKAANDALADSGSSARIDRRSYEEQGIDRQSQPKLGPTASQMEREGVPSRRGRELRKVRASNERRALESLPDEKPAPTRSAPESRPDARPSSQSRSDRKALVMQDHRAMVSQTRREAANHRGGWRSYLSAQAAAANRWRRAFLERQKARLAELHEKMTKQDKKRDQKKKRSRGR